MAIRDPFDPSDIPEGYVYGELTLGRITTVLFLPELPWYKRIVKVVQLLFRGWCHV